MLLLVARIIEACTFEMTQLSTLQMTCLQKILFQHEFTLLAPSFDSISVDILERSSFNRPRNQQYY